MEGNRVYLVRHAQSEYNEAINLAKQDPSPGLAAQVKLDPLNIDSPLTEKGRMQALSLRDTVRNLAIVKVFVSPMRRTLQTAQILFEEHPNCPEVTVLPLLTEQVKSATGISLGVLSHQFPEFRWNLMPDYHFQYDLCKPAEAALVRERSLTSTVQRAMLSRLIETYPQRWEKKGMFRDRVKRAVEFLKHEHATTQGSICVVSHRGVCSLMYRTVNGKDTSLSLGNGQIQDLGLYNLP